MIFFIHFKRCDSLKLSCWLDIRPYPMLLNWPYFQSLNFFFLKYVRTKNADLSCWVSLGILKFAPNFVNVELVKLINDLRSLIIKSMLWAWGSWWSMETIFFLLCLHVLRDICCCRCRSWRMFQKYFGKKCCNIRPQLNVEEHRSNLRF